MPQTAMSFTPGIIEDASGEEFLSVDHGTVNLGHGKQHIVDAHNANPDAILEVYEDEEGNVETYVDMTPSDVEVIHDLVGGEENYDAMIEWAAKSLPQEMIEEFDEAIERGDIADISTYTQALANMYETRQVDSNDEFINETLGRSAYNELMEIMDEEFDPESKEMVNRVLETRDLEYIARMLESVAEQRGGGE